VAPPGRPQERVPRVHGHGQAARYFAFLGVRPPVTAPCDLIIRRNKIFRHGYSAFWAGTRFLAPQALKNV
jgi:hypothetical protein